MKFVPEKETDSYQESWSNEGRRTKVGVRFVLAALVVVRGNFKRRRESEKGNPKTGGKSGRATSFKGAAGDLNRPRRVLNGQLGLRSFGVTVTAPTSVSREQMLGSWQVFSAEGFVGSVADKA